MNVKIYHYFTGILCKSDTFSIKNGICDAIGQIALRIIDYDSC